MDSEKLVWAQLCGVLLALKARTQTRPPGSSWNDDARAQVAPIRVRHSRCRATERSPGLKRFAVKRGGRLTRAGDPLPKVDSPQLAAKVARPKQNVPQAESTGSPTQIHHCRPPQDSSAPYCNIYRSVIKRPMPIVFRTISQ